MRFAEFLSTAAAFGPHLSHRRTSDDRVGRLPLEALTRALRRYAGIDIQRQHHEERVFEVLSDGQRPLTKNEHGYPRLSPTLRN